MCIIVIDSFFFILASCCPLPNMLLRPEGADWVNWILWPRNTCKRQLRCKNIHKLYFVCHFELLEPKHSSVHSSFIPFNPPANRKGPYKCNDDTGHIWHITNPIRLPRIGNKTLHVQRKVHVIIYLIQKKKLWR